MEKQSRHAVVRGLMMSLLALSIGCTTGNCRSQKELEMAKTPSPVDSQEKSTAVAASTDRVRVYKYDGSLQCGQGKAIPAAEMAKELAGIEVFSMTNKADGLMRIQVCGSPTGKANVFLISSSQLEEAKKRGFKVWTWD